MKARITREFTDRFFILFRALPRNLRLNNVLYVFKDDSSYYCFFSVNSNFCNPSL